MKKVYLSGKISGLAEEEYKANFAKAAADALQFFPDEQVSIVNPTTLPNIHNSWADYMLRDLMFLRDCDAIVMLPDWLDSIGAQTEHMFACGMGIRICYLMRDNELILSKESKAKYEELIKESIRNFGVQVIDSLQQPKVNFESGMLTYDNPPTKQ